MSVDYYNGNFSDEEIFARAKRYAAKQFDAVLQGADYTRHDINNATRIFDCLMKAAEAGQQGEPMEPGVLIAELMKLQGGDLRLAE